MESDEARIIDLAEHLAALRRRLRLLLALPLLVAALAYAVAWILPPVYRASAVVLVNPASSPSVEFPNDVVAANLLTRTFGKLVTEPPVLRRVLVALSLGETLEELGERLEVRAEADTQLIRITADYPDRHLAVAIANATGEAFAAWMNELQAERAARSAQALQETVDRLRGELEATTAEVTALRGRPGPRTTEEFNRIASLEAAQDQQQRRYGELLATQQRLELSRLAAQDRVSLVARAEVPERAASPHDLVITLLALLGGFGLTVAGILLFERAANRVCLPRDVRREVDLPVLAALPRAEGGVRELATAPDSPVSEGIRSLRARLRFAVNGRGLGAIAVVSGDGAVRKSTIVAQLALAQAQAGQRVIVIDGDLRAPRQHHLLGVPNGGGLATLLGDPDRSLEAALVPAAHPGLRLLPAGSTSGSAADLLADERLGRVIASARAAADVVLIDTPPFQACEDAFFLAAVADGVVIVAEAGRTRADALGEVAAAVRVTRADVLGVVLAGVDGAVGWPARPIIPAKPNG